ncbi:MAG TPA: hypothetical protein VMZ11_05820 [Mycobacteriales bacterium]|nr:hypothetical protein [Mycobacteriales bacterium]
MLIDCDDCAVRDLQCGDCVMTVLLGEPGVYEVDPSERLALQALAEGGLLPELRMVPLTPPDTRRHA